MFLAKLQTISCSVIKTIVQSDISKMSYSVKVERIKGKSDSIIFNTILQYLSIWNASLSYITWFIVMENVAYPTQSKNMLNVPIQ